MNYEKELPIQKKFFGENGFLHRKHFFIPSFEDIRTPAVELWRRRRFPHKEQPKERRKSNSR